jgi:hypothetical protein
MLVDVRGAEAGKSRNVTAERGACSELASEFDFREATF